MRILAGTQRGRSLSAPKGTMTRPTAQRTRQAVFDMLLHAPWYGRTALEDAHVLDVFAGTGALGLEALSRGARTACFIEQNRASFATISQNIRHCGVEKQTRLIHCDATRPPRAKQACSLVFLDPPYHKDLTGKALRALYRMGWIANHALIIAETENDSTEENPEGFLPFYAHLPAPLSGTPGSFLRPPLLAQRCFGVARISIWQQEIVVPV